MRRLPKSAIVFAVTAMTAFTVSAQPEPIEQPETINGNPNLNGVWQAVGSAFWNLESHSAEPLDDFWGLGAIGAIPAGQSVVSTGTIPYLPEALAKRDENRANWPISDPEASCFMLGIPRYTLHNMPFQIFQGDEDILMAYPFAAGSRNIFMNEDRPFPPIDTWMGESVGHWEDDTLVVVTRGQNDQSWLDRAGNHHSNQLVVTERYTRMSPYHLWYEATLEDPQTYSEPWSIAVPLYRRMEANAQILEHKCVDFADKLLYRDLMGLEHPSEQDDN